ncbi:MAG: nucleotidyltransferase domain-containing protein [Defluviitaleaceae bacterium]|nr:nucleotidyltransferase domain-containing protein [Defluviitaleaceae bacterium]
MSIRFKEQMRESSAGLSGLLGEVAFSIEQVHPECTVILFGSYARGEESNNSDLDICVLVPKLTSRREDMAVDAMCAIPDGFPIPYDLVLYTYAEFEEDRQNKNLLGYHIFKDGVILNDKHRYSKRRCRVCTKTCATNIRPSE